LAEKKEIVYKEIKSPFLIFNTNQLLIDDFIEEELKLAKDSNRALSRKILFS